MKRIFYLVIVFSLSFSFYMKHTAEAQDYSDRCHYTDGIYYLENTFPRYERRNQRLVLVSWTSGEIVREVETSFDTSRFVVLDWSPDCRYMTAGIGKSGLVIWDIVENRRAGNFEGASEKSGAWDPNSQYRLTTDKYGTWLWNVSVDQKFYLNDHTDGYHQIYWDYARNQLLMVKAYDPWQGSHGVFAYDLITGQEIFQFDHPGPTYRVGFYLSADNTRLIVYTHNGGPAPIIIWNRDTYEQIAVDDDNFFSLYAQDFLFSSDDKYLAIVNSGYVRIWNLLDLPEEIRDRDPLFIVRLRFRASTWYFVTPYTIELSNGQKTVLLNIENGTLTELE